MREMKQAIKRCEAAGLQYRIGGKHAKLINPKTGRSVPVSITPSDSHAVDNMLRDVRKYLGVNIK